MAVAVPVYPHRDARPPLMVLADLGAGYLNNADLPQNGMTLKAGLKALYAKAVNVSPHPPLKAGATDLHSHLNELFNNLLLNNSDNDNMTALEFVEMLLDLFQIHHKTPNPPKFPAVESPGHKVKLHLQSIFENAPENLFRVINNGDLKMTIWKLVMTDINLVIYKNKHCNMLDLPNYLGEDFCKFWDNTFRHTLTSTQLYSIITKLTSIQPGMPPREITETLLKLFNNKLAALGEVSYNRLWKTEDSHISDLSPFGPPPRAPPMPEAEFDGRGRRNKYLKYKAKYLALKNSMSN